MLEGGRKIPCFDGTVIPCAATNGLEVHVDPEEHESLV